MSAEREAQLQSAIQTLLLRWGDYLHFAERCGEDSRGEYLTQAKAYREEAQALLR